MGGMIFFRVVHTIHANPSTPEELGDRIGAVLTGGEGGADTYLLECDKFSSLSLDTDEHEGSYNANFEITDFDPEEDRLAITPVSLRGFAYDWDIPPGGRPGAIEGYTLDEISVEPDPDGGAYVDLVFTSERTSELNDTMFRIRLWGGWMTSIRPTS